jgi:diguanylate cyclase (GGDEF)-like protein/PAS domain S-box-containing protein
MVPALSNILVTFALASSAGIVCWYFGKTSSAAAGKDNEASFSIFIEELDKEHEASRELLVALLGATGDAVVQKSDAGFWLEVNSAASNLLKIPRESLIGRTTDEIAQDYPSIYSSPLCDLDAENEAWAWGDQPLAKEVTYKRFPGDRRSLDVVRVPVGTNRAEGMKTIVIVARDITSRMDAEEAANSAEQFARMAMDALSSNICILDQAGTIIHVNHSWKRFAEEHSAESHYGEGKNYIDICRKANSVDAQAVADGLQSILNGETMSFASEYRCVDHQDASKPYCSVLKASRADVGGKIHVVVSHEDITERKTSEETARYDATHDVMTGLYNRTFFEAEAERLAHSRVSVGVLMIDLDNLKKANDTFGHDAGDQLIQRAAVCLKRSARGDDLVARIGGDEFTVIIKDASMQTLSTVIRRIREQEEAINKNIQTTSVKLGLSIGAGLSDDKTPFAAAVKKADQMMYIEKSARKRG